MDVGRLESLARSVNVPRVREGGVRYIKDAQSGEETAISEVGSPASHSSALKLGFNASPRSRGGNRWPPDLVLVFIYAVLFRWEKKIYFIMLLSRDVRGVQ